VFNEDKDEDDRLVDCCAVMMEAASTCETSVNVYQITWPVNPQDRNFYASRRQKLKSHMCNKNRSVNICEFVI
jgi:hypothetical protein